VDFFVLGCIECMTCRLFLPVFAVSVSLSCGSVCHVHGITRCSFCHITLTTGYFVGIVILVCKTQCLIIFFWIFVISYSLDSALKIRFWKGKPVCSSLLNCVATGN